MKIEVLVDGDGSEVVATMMGGGSGVGGGDVAVVVLSMVRWC